MPCPSVNVTIDGIRKTNAGYMVTPIAMIPIRRHDHGHLRHRLGRIRSDGRALETSAVVGVQDPLRRRRAVALRSVDPTSILSGAMGLTEVRRFLAAGSPEPKPYSFPLKLLEEAIKEKATRDVVMEELHRRLDQPAGRESAHPAIRSETEIRVSRPARTAAGIEGQGRASTPAALSHEVDGQCDRLQCRERPGQSVRTRNRPSPC